jgi:hypothetical protein
MTDKTGGPAFPQHALEANQNGGEPRIVWQEGMTLRDFFAAKAMQALLSDPSWREDMNAQETAYASYAQAREMLKAREQ